MKVIVHLDDPRYIGGRDVDISDFTVADAERLCDVWAGVFDIHFSQTPWHFLTAVSVWP